MFGSLESRLAAQLLAVTLGFMAIASLVLVWQLRSTSDAYGHASLVDQIEDVRPLLEVLRRDGMAALPDQLLPAYRRGSLQLVMTDANGRVLVSIPDSAAQSLAPLLSQQRVDITMRDVDGSVTGQPQTALTRRMRSGGDVVLVTAAQSRPAERLLLDQVVDDKLTELAIILLPILALAGLIGVSSIRQALKPLGEVARRASAIGPLRADLRLPITGVPAEVVPLVVAVNGALDRLEDGFAFQRRFTADAAHQLRTPLAVIAARLDNLPPFEGQPQLKADVRRMSRLVGQLLAVARLEDSTLDVERPLALNAFAADVVGRLAPLALKQHRELAFLPHPGDPVVAGDGAALAEALSNLIENAINWSPAGSVVEIDVLPQAVRVLDRGPGVADSEKAAIFARFRRSRSERPGELPHGGAGLGLGIALEIMRRHRGSVTVNDRAGGGAIFQLRFPAQSANPASTDSKRARLTPKSE